VGEGAAVIPSHMRLVTQNRPFYVPIKSGAKLMLTFFCE
jgi:hypothetical protein